MIFAQLLRNSFLERKELKRLFELKEVESKKNLERKSKQLFLKEERSLEGLFSLLRYSGLRYRPAILTFTILFFNFFATLLIYKVFEIAWFKSFLLVLFLLYFEWSYLVSLVEKRANQFLDDFPSILLTMASSLKAGLTPFDALIKSVEPFSSNSLAKNEIDKLKERIARGADIGLAISSFAEDIKAPEIVSFRRALLLTLENGGSFVPSLERMAQSVRARRILARTVQTSTMTMRMTAFSLLLIGPFLFSIVSGQQPDYWETIILNPISERIAYFGIALIFCGLTSLDRMSRYRP